MRYSCLFFLLALTNLPAAQAADKFCSDAPYFGVIDGNRLPKAPTQITIDTTCTFQNWPYDNPLATNINFQTNDPSIYLIIFDNVYHTGNMACANIPHKLWVVNSREDAFSVKCQDFIVPAETIDKQSPIDFVGIGEEFTYRLTLPSMDYPEGEPSPNDIGDVVITDDLNATGASLTLVGTPQVIFADSGLPVAHSFTQSTATGGLLTFAFDNTILAGQQIYIDITVRVNDDAAINVNGTNIINTAEWIFSRSIDLDENGIIEDGTVDLDGDGLIEDEFFNPLPGESGIADPITIQEPNLIVSKTSDATVIDLGDVVSFTLDVHNTGGANAWDVTVTDYLPNDPTAMAGMCETDPSASLRAEIVAADGVTAVSGELQLGTDYVVSYSGTPQCRLTLTTISPKAAIGPDQHLLISYESTLDADTVGNNVALTNIAGADLWYSAPATNNRREFDTTITDGTPTLVDFQDAYTLTTDLSGYYFEKTATDPVTGTTPFLTAMVGQRVRYTLRLFNLDQEINNLAIRDLLKPEDFKLSSFTMINDSGTNASLDAVTGELTISGSSGALNVAQGDELSIVYEIDLQTNLARNYVVETQAQITADQNTASTADDFSALSDDPFVNGVADPSIVGDEDPTRIVIEAPGPLVKTVTQPTATIGEQFTYQITIPDSPINSPIYDVRILDNLEDSAADLRFVSAAVESGHSWQLVNSGSDTNVVLEDSRGGIDIPAGQQAIIAVTVELQNTENNNDGLLFSNTASYTYSSKDNDASLIIDGGAGVSGDMEVVEPQLAIEKTLAYTYPQGKPATEEAVVGDVIQYQVTLTNTGDATAFDISVTDVFPGVVELLAGSAQAEINGVQAGSFKVTPQSIGSGGVVWGALNGDGSLDLPVGQSLQLTYEVSVNEASETSIINSALAEWSSLDGNNSAERDGQGCPAVTSPDDYCVGPAIASVDVSKVAANAIAKRVTADSYAESPTSTSTAQLRVGDTVTYELILDLQEYNTRNLVVTDTLPEGMAFQQLLDISPASGSAGFGYALQAQPNAGDRGVLNWNFGEVINQPSNDDTPIDQLVIRYQARVLPEHPPQGIAVSLSSQLTNQVALSFIGGDPELYPDRLTGSAVIEVLQPQMSELIKRDTVAGREGTGVAFDPYQVDTLNDTMSFEVSSCNNGLAPAYGVMIRDQLPPELDERNLQSARPQVTVGGRNLSEGTDFTLSLPARGGQMEVVLQDSAPVLPNQCVTLKYRIGFHDDIAPFSTWNNMATLAEYRSLPLSQNGRIYQPASTARVYMTNQLGVARLANFLVSDSEATIGDEVRYELHVPAVPQNAALLDVRITNTLPLQLELTDISTVDSAGNPVVLTNDSATSGTVNLAIGQIPAGETLVISLTTRVRNIAEANAADVLINRASYRYAELDPAADTSGDSEAVTLVEPELGIAKQVINLTAPDTEPTAGDLLRYSLTFTASGGATGDPFSDAFDLTIEDTLGLGLRYQAGSASVNGTDNSISDPQLVAGDGVTSSQQLTWDLGNGSADIDVLEGTQVTVSYEVLVENDVQAGQTLTNSAMVRWTGRDSLDANERTGTLSPAFNDYVAGPAETSTMTRLDVDVVKSVVNLSTGQSPGTDASPGDTLQYTLELTNNSIIPLTNAVFEDVLDAAFAAGSLQWVRYPETADISGTNVSGGANGSGVISLRNFTLAAAGEAGNSVTLIFSAQLSAVLDSGTQVMNTGLLSGDNLSEVSSNTTTTLIASAPLLQVEKISDDLTDDASILQPGDTLRYTLRVTNIGNENATSVTLHDLVPTFTTYIPGSTTLNGNPVADPSEGVSPLQDGMDITTANSAAAGMMPADPDAGVDMTAVITFDVTINDGVVGGTAIANQGFVNGNGAGSGPIEETPSDDPDTATENDPTVDVVGEVPWLDAHKTVELQVDAGSNGVVDPGDVLRYTIVIRNQGTVDATGVRFVDAVPANSEYIADSVRLNNQPLGQADGGVSPLESGIEVQSDDGADNGVISAGASATVVFDVRVDAAATPGSLIRNQGVVISADQDDEPTDADGIDSNGDQPTDTVVGDVQLLSIVEEVFDVNGGVVLAGDELEYVVTVTNVGNLAAKDVTLHTDLDQPVADHLSYVEDSARLQGGTGGVSFADPNLTANYAIRFGDLAAGENLVLRFRAVTDANLATGTTITNISEVFWNADSQSEAASASVVIGAPPGNSASLAGLVWHDLNNDKLWGADENALSDWVVELYRNTTIVANTRTDDSGQYRFVGVSPNAGSGSQAVYSIRFVAPSAGEYTAKLGVADSPFSNALQLISDIQVSDSSITDNLNLPLLPNGVLYDALTRQPVAGAQVRMLNASTLQALPANCFDDPNQQGQQVSISGYYRFDLNFSDSACGTAGSYLLQVSSPTDAYEVGVSRLIPPQNDATGAAFDVPACLGSVTDAVSATADLCEVVASAGAPAISVPARTAGTDYYLHLAFSNRLIPGESQLFNNHIPLDPILDNAVAVRKVAGKVNVSRGDLVPYTITIKNSYLAALQDLVLVDTFPPGFKYVEGSARYNGEALEPQLVGGQLRWDNLDLSLDAESELQLLFIPGGGVSEGEYINRAHVESVYTGESVSNSASATVRVVPDPTLDCSDIYGKVFDDANFNGHPDPGERGIAGARVVSARGLLITADEHGRFHLTCAAVPNELRGSNFILKVDERSLPSGYRLTSENPRVIRLTRGKAAKFNFGASLHRVVRLDVADGVFQPNSTDMRTQWLPRIPLLLAELQKAPSIVRVAYLADVEDEKLVQARVKRLKTMITEQWESMDCCYTLNVETEVYWRRGSPPDRSGVLQ